MLCLTAKLYAQPGGGGGLVMGGVYTGALKPVNLLSDTSIQIRTFILSGQKIYRETFIHEQFIKENGRMRISRGHYGFGLPPTGHINGNDHPVQRMWIVYEQDTMVIDFSGIIGQNAGGCSDRLDSLVVQKGYFKFYRTKKYGNYYDRRDYNRNRRLLKSGLTLYTAEKLSGEGYIEYHPLVDTSFFLPDKNPPASYLLKRTAFFLPEGQ